MLRVAVTPVAPVPGAAQPAHAKANFEVVLQATRDCPPECYFEYKLYDSHGPVAESGVRLPAGENRPSSWWHEGEAWRDRVTIDLPAGKTLEDVHGQLEVLLLEPLLRSAAEAAGR